MVKFQNEFVVTKNLFIEQCTNELHVWLGISSCISGFLCLLTDWKLLGGVLIVFAALCFICLCIEESLLTRAYKNQLEAHENVAYEVKAVFYDDHFTFVTNYGANETLSYGSIVRSSKRNSLIVLFIDRGYSISIKKDCFTVGTLESFQHFMSVKGF